MIHIRDTKAFDLLPSLISVPARSPQRESYVARQLRCRLQGLHHAAFWRAQGFPNLARARAVQAKLGEERRRQEAARRFSPFALKLAGKLAQYEMPTVPRKPAPPRKKQVYKSRLKFLRSREKPVAQPK